jgi:hypothetical protein
MFGFAHGRSPSRAVSAGRHLPSCAGLRNVRGVFCAIALTSLVAASLVWSVGDQSTVAEAAPGAAVFEPMDGAVSFGPAAFGRVVADGNGTFLAVQRVQLPIGQFIGVRRSDDGGLTWATKGLFTGSNGGGTRPWISVSGPRVAVGFIGSWCDPSTPGVCGEAPFLVTSPDSGSSWGSPRRLDTQAFEIRVAQDGDRTWVAWERSGSVELRGTRDGGTTMFATRSMPAEGAPELAASGGLAVVAYRGIVDRLTRAPLALVAVGDAVSSTAAPLGDPLGDEEVWPLAVGVADGRLHVLTRRSSKTGTDPTLIDVMTATSAGAFTTVNVIGEAGRSASLVAGPGTVAVAIGTDDGVTSVATSSDGGDTFSALVPVTSTGEREPNVQIGLAVRPTDRPTARFGWTVPPRLVDEDGDGFIDPANDTGIDSADQLRVYGGRTLDVTLDGCASTAPSGRTIASYRWTEVQPDGSTVVLPFGACHETLSFESGEQRTYRLDVVDSAGEQASTLQVVAPRDLVVASLGDSVASGEGNPHEQVRPGFPARWQDAACHRSVDAGPAVAAKRLEDADPHTSVTFVQLACSGAAIVDSPEVPGIDDPTTGGVLDSYIGQQPSAGSLRPSQIEQLGALLGARQLDALMVSVGANDARFSDVVMACIKTSHCERTSVRTDFEARAATLPGRYARLAAAIDDLGVDASDVHISEYFDPTVDELGVVEMRCAVAGGVFDLLDDDEARWAGTGVMGALNSAVSAASATYGWHYVGGVAAAFAGHGYCSTDPWVVQIAESMLTQGNVDGAFHPNAAGHAAYAHALYTSLRASLLLPAPIGGGTAVGADLLGDIVVMTSTRSSVIATGLRDTGGVPSVLGSRLVDRIVSGEGGLYSFGPAAIDRTAAVGVWTQLPISGLTLTEELAAQIAVRPNAAVRAVSVVQAPIGGAWLVANRDALVSATIDAAINEPMDLAVSVDVVTLPADPDDPSAPPGRPVLATATSIRLRPGINKVLLPTTSAFQLAPGEKVSATVTVTDPPGASPADDVDNTLGTDDSSAKEAIETRPLTMEFMSPTTSAGRVPCGDLSEIARRQIAFARAATPISSAGVLPVLSCGELYPLPADEASILRYLSVLDWLARHSSVDIMVGVVPGGWLTAAAGGAVGIAAPGMRAVLIEQSSPAMTLAHEVAHTFGVDHVVGAPRATGVRVDQRRHLDGTDWMAARTPEKAWTGAKTWDDLAVRFGPPGGIPAAPVPLSPELEINGTVTNSGENLPGEWTPGNTGSPRSDLDDLELERMQVEQVDADGNVVATDEAPLRPVEGLYSPDAPEPEPIGFAYETRITLLPDTASVRLVLDGTIVEERPVGDVPEVTVASPTAGTEIRRGDPITVAWSTAAPVGPGATASVLISQDGGVTWKPLATGVSGTEVVVDAPADLVDGNAIVRVVVVDGLRSGQGDSGVIDIGVPVQLLAERVVAVRTDLVDLTVPGATMPAQPGQGIWTMNPDGTDLEQVVPMVPPVNGEGGMVPLHPDWRGDGMAIAFDGEVSGRRDLFVVDRDGANLRRITDATTSPGLQFVCADWNPDGRQLLAYRTSVFDPNQVTELELVVVDTVTGVVTPFGWSALNYYNPATAIGCPRWSPDGGEVLMATEFLDRFGASDTNVFVIDVATKESKYAYFPNNGALQGNAYSTWLNFAPSNDDRFVNVQELFGAGYLKVAEPVSTPLFIGQDVVFRDLPSEVWRADAIPLIQQSGGLFGSAGFMPDGNSVWFTSTRTMQPRRYSEQRFDFRVGFYTVIVSESVGHLCRVPVLDSFRPTDPVTCYAPGGDGVPVDAIADEVVALPDSPSPRPTIGVTMADWHSGVSAGVDPNPPVVIGDPATLPPDPEDPPPGDVEVPSPDGDPADGADDLAPGPLPAPVPTTITVRAGTTTTAVLPSTDGAPSSFTIVASPDAGTVDVTPTSPSAADPTTTGPDGAVDITPAPGFVGTASFQVAARGEGADPVTITVEVVAAPVPAAVDDQIEVERGALAVIDPETLLANDGPPSGALGLLSTSAADPLRVVSVYGVGGGTAVLRRDGQIEVEADTAGSFTYTVVDGAGATGNARVVVRLAAAPPATQPTTAPPPPSTSTSGPPTTAAPITDPPSTVSSTSPAINVATTTRPGQGAGTPTAPPAVALPATGADTAHGLRVALTILVVGVVLMVVVRRRDPASRGR